MDYMNLKKIKFYISADDFFKSKINERVILITTKAKKLYTDFKFKKGDTLLFGKESAGVPQEVHVLLKNKLKIPMIDKKRSLNLSTSVAIILAESLRQLK
jgi:tRNA (cytidine/uridine-2'-O-)-methyltransferase